MLTERCLQVKNAPHQRRVPFGIQAGDHPMEGQTAGVEQNIEVKGARCLSTSRSGAEPADRYLSGGPECCSSSAKPAPSAPHCDRPTVVRVAQYAQGEVSLRYLSFKFVRHLLGHRRCTWSPPCASDASVALFPRHPPPAPRYRLTQAALPLLRVRSVRRAEQPSRSRKLSDVSCTTQA